MIAVRPPEYWPRPAFFALMDAADVFVLADTFQYSRQSFQNRAKLRTPDGWQWITVPLKGGQHGRPVKDVEIRTRQPWIGKHWRALHFNYRTTPFFEFYEPRLRPLFEEKWERLNDFSIASITLTADLLGIRTPLHRSSELSVETDGLETILRTLGREDLIVPQESLEVDAEFASAVLELEPVTYRQNFEGFESGMSALDLLFNYGPEALQIIRASTRTETRNADAKI